jgi:polyisoprenyl-teichoic acid--peptidoglycan teichoic acid transferase
MNRFKKTKYGGKKKAAIIVGSITGALVILCLCGYLIINGYLNKIKYDPGVEALASEISSEPDDPPESYSPKTEIDAMNRQAEQNLSMSSTPILYDKDVFNVLLIGSDTRTAGGRGRSDSMILVSINKKTSKITATSLLRDIYLQIPGVSQGNRLNTANAFGGPALLLDTIQQNFKIKVDKYIAVDFFSFMDIVDKVGGVEINVTDPEIKVANSYIQGINTLKGLPENDGELTLAGKQTLTGKQALSYARIRYVGNGDFERTDRQRLVLGYVFSKIKTRNISQLNDLLNTFLPEVTTNLSKSELFSLILSMPSYTNYTIDSWRVPVDESFSYLSIRGMSVLGIDFSKNIAEMRKRIYG